MTTPHLHCTYYDRLLPALGEPPIAGELGVRIVQSVSAQGWNAWIRTERIFIAQFDIDSTSPQYERKRQAAIQQFFFGPPEGPRMVDCLKFQRSLPGLVKPPFPGVLGMRI